MLNSFASLSPARWISDDYLVRIEHGAIGAGGDPDSGKRAAVDEWSSKELPVVESGGAVSTALAGDPESYECFSALHSKIIPTETLFNFAARHMSTWALDVLAARVSNDMADWPSIRMAATHFAKSKRACDPVLDCVPLDALWGLCKALHERGFDERTEQGLLSFIAARSREGKDVGSQNREDFMEALIASGDPSSAETCFPRLAGTSWRQHALSVELEHPRFGGEYEVMLVRLNQAFRRLGFEGITIDGEGESPFEKLTAAATVTAMGSRRQGPLVTVIMTVSDPGSADISAVRSILSQIYGDLEVIVVDDASAQEFLPVLKRIEGLDARVRVLRNNAPIGPYASRNVAIREATGEFVAFQTSRAWSHPRRLEIQVHDLLASPGRVANVVRSARMSSDLSLVGRRGARFVLAESSIMFRKEYVDKTIGYFDTVRSGAGNEFRTRIEAASGQKVGMVGPEVPLQFVLVDGFEEDELEYGSGIWMSDAWLAYRGSIRRFHRQIKTRDRSPYVSYPQDALALVSPSRLRDGTRASVSVDILVVLDGHQVGGREEFIDCIAEEIETATANGLAVALLQMDAPFGVRNAGPLAERLQVLIDDGLAVQVLAEDEVEAGVIVIRQAGAAQGHTGAPLAMNAKRVVIVEDRAAGDILGQTFARRDVTKAVTAWFGLEPTWVVAPPVPPRPKVVSVIVDEDAVRVAMKAVDPDEIEAIRFAHRAGNVEAPTNVNDDGLIVASIPARLLPEGEVLVSVVRQCEVGGLSAQQCWVAPKMVLSRTNGVLLTSNGRTGLRVTTEAKVVASFASAYLSAEVEKARIFRGEIQLLLDAPDTVTLNDVVALREVDGQVRKRTFVAENADQPALMSRAISDLLDTRWKLFGEFQTPRGHVLAPVVFGDSTSIQNSTSYRIRKLMDKDIGVLHIVRVEERRADEHVPQLSIVMPVYNVGPYLDTAIRSVLTQDFTDFELIIVDDASSDNGRRIIEMHQALDTRIRVIELDHNTLGGAGIPSNLGIRAARGKYLAFVDSDDWVTQSALGRMVQIAEAEEAELVIGDFRTFDENDRSIAEAYDSAAWRSIPLMEVISGGTHPSLFRLSPVPWRKLYRRDFVMENGALYPEGDYFYEDNPLHWHVLSRAKRIVACSEIVSYHRMAREGQTMGASAYKLGAIASHANTILNLLMETDSEHRGLLFEEFIDYVSRQRWIVRQQTQQKVADILKTRLARIYDRAVAAEPSVAVPEKTQRHFSSYRGSYPNLDLTIIIPVYNSVNYLADTLDSVLQIKGLRYDVLLIDDGSDDQSLALMRKYEAAHDNIHVFEQKNRGAGRARNALIPLATGRYTYFLDADDTIDPKGLAQAVLQADAEDSDLMFVEYKIEFTEEGRERGMFDADQRLWDEIVEAASNRERQRLAAGLINYPWNRVIRTALLHDANIFFGATVVHNDVLFHWHSVLAASRIGIANVVVCTHRKFKSQLQVTNIRDERRVSVLDALRDAYDRISQIDNYSNVCDEWVRFSAKLLTWAQARVPEGLATSFAREAEALSSTFLAGSRDLPESDD